MPRLQQKPWIDLKKLREARGWDQQTTSENLGFCRSYIATLENGKQGFSLPMINAIIRVFGVKYEDFYNNDKNKK